MLGVSSENFFAIPHESEVLGADECEGELSGAEYVATFAQDIFVYNTVIAIPEGSNAIHFADVEVSLDHPDNKRPVRCGKKFSRAAAKKLKSSEIIFICRGAGKTRALGRQASDAKIFIKRKVKKGETRCLDFTGISFNTIQDDIATWSDWGEWSECEDDTVTRSRTCSGIFCDEEIQTESMAESCLKCEPGFEPNEDSSECVDVDECAAGLCPEDSTCENTEGSYTCACNEGFYGDDLNFCIEPRACHTDAEDNGCYCQALEANVTEVVTWWNNTIEECMVEYYIHFEEMPVNSWSAELEFEQEASVEDIWRARTEKGIASYQHKLDAMYFNYDKVMPMRFHARFDMNCDEFESEEVPFVTLCTEDLPESTSQATSQATTRTTAPATTTSGLQLTEELCINVDIVTEDPGWQTAEGETSTLTEIHFGDLGDIGYHEWRIELPFDDAVSHLEFWTAVPNFDEFWTLTSMDYNAVLSGFVKFNGIVTGNIPRDDDGNTLDGRFCYKYEISN